jgi:V8-like Glu-specific endopeptidase
VSVSGHGFEGEEKVPTIHYMASALVFLSLISVGARAEHSSPDMNGGKIIPLHAPTQVGRPNNHPTDHIAVYDFKTKTEKMLPSITRFDRKIENALRKLGMAKQNKSLTADSASDWVFSEVSDTTVQPYSQTVHILVPMGDGNYGLCSGALIDPKFVITAGHCVYGLETDSFYDYEEMVVYPASTLDPLYGGPTTPFGTAKAVKLYVWTAFTNPSGWIHPSYYWQWDIGVIELDRPVGALTGWYGYDYNDSADFYAENLFLQNGYPSDANGDGDVFGDYYTMWGWGGAYSGMDDNALFHSGYGCNGLSGAAASRNNIVYAVATAAAELPCSDSIIDTRTTEGEVADLDGVIIGPAHPTTLDLMALGVTSTSQVYKSGQSIKNARVTVHNYSSFSLGFALTVRADVYLSTDSTISASDVHIGYQTVTTDFAAMGVYAIPLSNLRVPPNLKAGGYYLGVVLTDPSTGQPLDDYNETNNASNGQEAFAIEICWSCNVL